MSMKRSRPGAEPRKGKAVGPDYPAANFDNPFNVGIDKYAGSKDSKTLFSPTETIEGDDLPLNEKSYDGLWEGR